MAQYAFNLLQENASAGFTLTTLSGTAGRFWNFDATTRAPVENTTLTFDTSGHLNIADAKNIILNTTTGTKIGTAVGQKLGFWNVTPVVQPSGANQAALTDSTTGVAAFTLVDVTGAHDQAILNANFASIARLINQLRSDLVAVGIIKGSA